MEIYDYTCAVCELTIRASSGESVTGCCSHYSFLHFIQRRYPKWNVSLQIASLAFDTGLISLNDDYQVIVSPLMSEQGPTEGMLTQLRDKCIWTPEDDQYHPDKGALEWHRMRVLRV